VDAYTIEPGTCINDHTCRGDHTSLRGPLCDTCLDDAEHDIRNLVYDYLDLAQLHETSLSQAITEHTTGGSPESPMPLVGHIEALQAEIVHATALWEHALRAVARLHNPCTFTPLWRTRVYDHRNLITGRVTVDQARAGALVQRGIGIIAARIDLLAGLPAATVCPTGIEDEPQPMHGWEAVHHLQHLHKRSRAALGRTVRKTWIYGDCWTCGARQRRGEEGPLYRAEPRYPDDPMQVNCADCHSARPYRDYERFMTELQWPDLEPVAA